MIEIAASRATISEQAKTAWLSGLTLADNPYPVDSEAFKIWKNAFVVCAFEFDCQ
jgi:hypothetical protein